MVQYVLNPRIAADMFDGDLILANLDTGIYYSLTGQAVFLISQMPFESPEKEMEQLAGKFEDREEEALEDLKSAWEKLKKEEIVVRKELKKEAAASFHAGEPAEYVPSKLSKYADMQDLLMLDPIHEVDEDGWAVQEDEPEKEED